MSSPSTIPPPPGLDPTSVKLGTGDRVKGAIGGFLSAGAGLDFKETPLGKQLAQKQQALVDKAALHHKNVSTFAGVLATGTNPNTGQPLTPEERQQYENWYNQEWAEYQKIAGHDKETKGKLGKIGAVLEHVIGRGGAGGAGGTGGGAQGGQQQQGIPPPPTQSAPAAAQASSTLPPPPGMMAAQFPSEQVQQQSAEAAYQRKGDIDTANKIKVLKAGPHHLQKAAVKDPTTGKVIDASYDPTDGKYYGQDGSEIIGAQPATSAMMRPQRINYLDPTTGKPRMGFQIGNELYDDQMQQLPSGVEPYQRGLVGTESTSTQTDPYGNVSTTRTVRKPMTKGAGASATPAAGGAGSGGTTPRGLPKPPARTTGTTAGTSKQDAAGASKLPPLDADGHVQAVGGANSLVVEAANQLLDGQDLNKLPQKVREPAARMARQYGWEQGKFTPREQSQLRTASTFITEALHSDALSALDGDFTDRALLAQMAANPDKEGFLQRTATSAAAQNLSPAQAKFMRLYNQLVGTISGLGQLVRSGRVTEATIERLKSELPNPVTTKDSADARIRIKRLLKEIDVALQKGTFEGPRATGAAPRAGIPTPPSGAAAAGAPVSDLDAEIMKHVKAAKGVK
jgi:hypothetical protein